ncbi:unnamed protein product [Orchesella dallaii]|uniref:Methyltransferase FkbM domain-containing protein n=1 Tax=Orchesella dallaii TaxID=48710 RepID=A0ABP1R1P6_9HEXA
MSHFSHLFKVSRAVFITITFIFVITWLSKSLKELGLGVILKKSSWDTDSYTPLTVNIDYVEENLLTLDQTDAQLITYTRIRHLTPPSQLPYALDGPLDNPSHFADNFSIWVSKFFHNKRNGIFIEAGAHKGENPSHSLMLELGLNWTGLLVECNPTLLPILKKRHRKAWIADVCLAPNQHPGINNFFNPTKWSATGKLETAMNKRSRNDKVMDEVRSIPLYTLIAAIGWKEIDYFALDVEGAEWEILQTIPFHLLTIKVNLPM